MDNQTTLNGAASVSQGLRENLSGLAHDALTLAELQMQLLSVDLRDGRRDAGSGFMQLLIGSVLALGCIPILMLAAAHALIEFLHWPAPAAYAAIGITSAVGSAVLLRLGWGGIVRALATVQRSRAEFGETLRWLKDSLKDNSDPRPEIGPSARIRKWRM